MMTEWPRAGTGRVPAGQVATVLRCGGLSPASQAGLPADLAPSHRPGLPRTGLPPCGHSQRRIAAISDESGLR